MLVLNRKCGEVIQIGPDIRVRVVRISADSVRIGIEAPLDVQIMRTELLTAEEAEPNGQEGLQTTDEKADDRPDTGGDSGTLCGHPSSVD